MVSTMSPERCRDERALRPRFPNRAGFTLVELLVVIAVLTVLIAILLPSLARAKRQARRIVCMTNMRGLGLAAQNYQTEFEGVLPWEGYAEGDRPIRSVGRWSEPTSWFNSMLAYGGQVPYAEIFRRDAIGQSPMPKSGGRSLLICPEAGEPYGTGPGDLVQDGYFMMYGMDDDGNPNQQKTYWCYGFNTQLDGGLENRNNPPTYHVYVNMKQIRSPQCTVLLAEKLMRADEFKPAYASNVCQSIVSWREFTTRHDGGGFLLFLDNHVEYFKRAQVFNTPSPIDMNQPGSIVWNPAGVAQ
jgi:prepilin-type N-terminal cleavage/methylation domain-containing protein